MSESKILIEVHRTLGEHSANFKALSENIAELKKDVKEIKVQTTKTNGRVSELEIGHKNNKFQISKIVERLDNIEKGKKGIFKLSWQVIVAIAGAVAIIIAAVIERLTN